MHCLEHVLFVVTKAVAEDEICKAELVRVLKTMLGASGSYSPDGEEPADLIKANAEWSRRVGHLMYPDGIEEGEQ